MKAALVHDWLYTYAGSERVLRELVRLMPGAPVHCLFCHGGQEFRQQLGDPEIRESFIARLPFVRRNFQLWLPLMPLAIEQFDLSEAELVVSSSHAVAKGALVGPDQVHVSYVHSPIRYAWDMQAEYLRLAGLDRGLRSALARLMLFRMRNWDVRSANNVDHYVANSAFVARRIWRVYRREARVVHPPVDITRFAPGSRKDDFFLFTSRLVGYKRVDLLVEVFRRRPDLRLIVIGDGPERARLAAESPSNVTFLGFQPQASVIDHMQRARAFLFAALEDFGIVPIEAQACGTPVIALGRGGTEESIAGLDAERPTGVHFAKQTVEAISVAISAFEAVEGDLDPGACRANAERFSPQRFRSAMAAILSEATGAPITSFLPPEAEES